MQWRHCEGSRGIHYSLLTSALDHGPAVVPPGNSRHACCTGNLDPVLVCTGVVMTFLSMNGPVASRYTVYAIKFHVVLFVLYDKVKLLHQPA
jgi:hypothetical protein